MKCIEDEIPFEVPEGWAWCRLNSIVDVRDGTHDTPTYVDKGIPLITSKNLVEGGIDYSNVKYISEKDAISINERSGVNIGDILFAMIGTIGNPSMVTEDILISIKNVALFKFTFSKNLSNHFVMYFLDYAQEDMKNKPSGGLQPFVSLNFLRTYLVPIPPVEEQQRIVSILADSINKIRNIDVLKNELTASVKKAKSKILDLAIRGKLVPQDPNDEPASVLLERIRDEKEELIKQGKIKRDKKESVIFKGDDNSYYQDLPSNWINIRLSAISEIITKGTTPRGGKIAYSQSGIGFLRAENIAGYDKLDLLNLNYVDEESHKNYLKRSILKENDILITIAGTLGRTAIVPQHTLPLNCNQAVAIVRLVNNKLINVKYLAYTLNSPIIKNDLLAKSVDMAIPNLSLDNIAECNILLPPLLEQKRIVDEIEKIFATLDDIANQLA